MLRLATLSAFVVAVGMIRTHLTPRRAWIVVGVVAGLAVVGLAVPLGATRRLEVRLGIQRASQAPPGEARLRPRRCALVG